MVKEIYKKEEEKFNFETEWLNKNSPEYLQKRFDFLYKCLGRYVVGVVIAHICGLNKHLVLKEAVKCLNSTFNTLYRGGTYTPEQYSREFAILRRINYKGWFRKTKKKRV